MPRDSMLLRSGSAALGVAHLLFARRAVMLATTRLELRRRLPLASELIKTYHIDLIHGRHAAQEVTLFDLDSSALIRYRGHARRGDDGGDNRTRGPATGIPAVS